MIDQRNRNRNGLLPGEEIAQAWEFDNPKAIKWVIVQLRRRWNHPTAGTYFDTEDFVKVSRAVANNLINNGIGTELRAQEK